MNDSIAKSWLHVMVGDLERRPTLDAQVRDLQVAALRHALQAIEDRQALIDAALADSDCYSDQPGKMLPGTVAVVRLHVNEE